VLSHPSHGNLAVALLARRPDALQSVISKIRSTSPNAVLEAFPSDTSKASIEKAFSDIKSHKSFVNLKLKVAVYSVKHSSKKSFLEETREDFEDSLETYVGGAFTFAQESVKRLFADHGETALVDGGEKKGVCPVHSLSFSHNTLIVPIRPSSSQEPSAHSGAARNSPPTVPGGPQFGSSRRHLRAS
jgi:NAD(P)-dependent dehydrogenase (short-subunit alcohol dehydrogenase family)